MLGPNRQKFNDLVERLSSIKELKGDEELGKLITKLKLRMYKRGYCSGNTLNELSQAIILNLSPMVDELEKKFEGSGSLTRVLTMELKFARDEKLESPRRASFFLHAHGHLKAVS